MVLPKKSIDPRRALTQKGFNYTGTRAEIQIMKPELVIIARGWDHEGWWGRFYPSDLPPDWRLPYYANEFRGAMIPLPSVLGCSPETVRRWVQDIPAGFRFFLELPAQPEAAKMLVKLKPLHKHLGGILLVRGGRTGLSPLEWRELLTPLAGYPMCLDSALFPHGTQDLPGGPGLSLSWPGGAGPAPGETLALGRLKPTQSLRALREQIAAFLGYAERVILAALVLDGQPPDIEMLRQARMIGEVLGH